jgi:DNA repair protein SbcD/Mre11
MKILHLSDLHYCAKHLSQVDMAVAHAIDMGIAANCQVAILSGDQFDTAVSLHEPAVDAFFHRIRLLADIMPVLVLQGTFSHDRPGSLAPLRKVGGKHPIYVAERITQVGLNNWGQWVDAGHYAFDDIPKGAKLVVSCLPSINKGAVAAAVGAENVGEKAGEMVTAVCRGWAGINLAARAAGIPTVLVTHGTVNGAITETAHAMVSKDHEFTSGALFGAEASAVMVGHIHRRQQWEHQGRRIAYPGSITKLIHGHCGENGALLWEVRADSADFTPIDTPSRRMIELAYPGLPDMADLERAAADCTGAYVRIRGSVDEEHRKSLDKDGIRALFRDAADVQIEIRVNPVQRVRAAGISQAKSLSEQLGQWCQVTETKPDPLLERLHLLQHKEPGEIIDGVVAS